MINPATLKTRHIFLSSFPLMLLCAGLAISHAYATEIEASDGANSDFFGVAVSISGDTAIAGAYGADDNGSYSGSAYAFRNLDTSGSTITENLKLTASGNAVEDNFGISVGISGTTAIVGANQDDDRGSNSGSAYVFRNLGAGSGTITENLKLLASDGAGSDSFGIAVGISGNTAIVGANQDDDNGSASGSAYVFRNVDSGSGTITENLKLIASDGAANDQFGYSIAISGTTAIAGAMQADHLGRTDSGSAYVFRDLDSGSGTITQNLKLTASDGTAGDQFGWSVGVSGNSAIAGARSTDDNGSSSGSAYVFRNLDSGSGTVTESLKLLASDGAEQDFFGKTVGISGTIAIVGADGDDDKGSSSGSAYLFRNLDAGSGTITENLKLTASDGTSIDFFGSSVDIDGDNFVIGAQRGNGQMSESGKAYTGSVSSLTTLDTGSTSRSIDGISFASRDDWIIGQTTDGNQVTLTSGDTGTVVSADKAVYIGQNAGSDNNTLVIGGTLTANQINVGATDNTGNTLVIDGNVTAPVLVAAGSEISGSGTLNGLLTLGSGATLAPGNSPGTLTLASGLTLNAGSFLNFELGNPLGTAGVDSDLILITGGTLSGPTSGLVTINFIDAGGFGVGTYDLINGSAATFANFETTDFALGNSIAGYDYSFGLSGGILQVTTSYSAVPEPSTYAAILGLLALGAVIVRKRRTQTTHA
jgi:hypothetical protein